MARAAKACSEPSCPNVQPCEAHGKKAWAGSTRRTRTVSGSRQQKRRRFVLLRDNNTCHCCGEVFFDSSLVADHVIPLAEGGADVVTNMAPCCTGIASNHCHEEKSQAEARRVRQGRRLEVSIFAVVGLPAAGKSTVCRQLAQEFGVRTLKIDDFPDWTALLDRIEQVPELIVVESNVLPSRYLVLLAIVPSMVVEIVASQESREQRLKARGISDLENYLTPHRLAPKRSVKCEDYEAVRERYVSFVRGGG